MKLIIRPALMLFILLSLITGVIYPLMVTGIGKLFFPQQSSGNLMIENGAITGSELIGQNFSSPRYFWGRPSATGDHPYNALASGGSNFGPLNPEFLARVTERVKQLRKFSPQKNEPVPVDLVTSSASGLDPDVSPAAALYQMDRIARARKISVEKLQELVDNHTEGRQFGLFGEPRVNILKLNLALDAMDRSHDRTPPKP